jgi:hypothetical protein
VTLEPVVLLCPGSEAETRVVGVRTSSPLELTRGAVGHAPKSRTDSPHQVGTGTGIGYLPGDPPQVHVHNARVDASRLAILATVGDRFRKGSYDHDPIG